MASCGRFLLSDFISKKNDLYSLKKVHDDIVKIQDSVDDQLSRLRKFDDTFCQTCKNGSSRKTLKKGKIHHHQFNLKIFEDILSLQKKIVDLLTKLNVAETKIKGIFKCASDVPNRNERKRKYDNQWEAGRRNVDMQIKSKVRRVICKT